MHTTELERAVVIEDSGAVELYRSRDDANADLEAIDVEAGAYRAFDTQGRELILNVQDGKVHVGPPTGASDLELLERLIRRHARAIPTARLDVDANTAPLSELIHAILGATIRRK